MGDFLARLCQLLFVVGFAGVALSLYMLPTVYAYLGHRKQRQAIGFLNFFLGWTFIGWVVCWVWAAVQD